jgi:hypothetical protein
MNQIHSRQAVIVVKAGLWYKARANLSKFTHVL